MRISILHLSDLHFTESNNLIIEKQTKFFDAIKNNVNISSYLFIVVTGDIVNSGKSVEYSKFENFIKSFEKSIKQYCQDITVEYIFAPGNHDCDFSIPEQEARDAIILNTILPNPSNTSLPLVNLCSNVQESYFSFTESLHNKDALNEELSNKLLYRYEFDLKNGEKISFNSYNFSFMSQKKEKQADLIFPMHLIDYKKILSNKNSSRLNISLFHHPLHWLKHTSIRDFTEFINESSDIVFSGHEHTSRGKELKDIFAKDYIEYIESGALQDLHNPNDSKFNLINIELSLNNQEIITYFWEEGGYSSKIAEHRNVPTNNKNSFTLASEYKENICTLNLKLKHPRKDTVVLSDLFVYPDLKSLNQDKAKEKSNFIEISSKDLINNKPKCIILYGSDNAGKTSLARKLQISYKKAGLIPVYIDGREIKSNRFSIEDIKKQILKSFKYQYFSDNPQIVRSFEQTDMDEIILLIDDFDLMKVNNENKGLFVENLRTIGYSNIVLFANETLIFEATSESILAKKLDIFNHYMILKFGYKLRLKLITKWITLGQENEINEKDLIFERKEKADAIKTTIGLNLVPSRPFYILTLLQAMTMHESNQLDKSSYGNYYHYLIMKNINTPVQMKPSDINTLFSYVSLLAYEMFKNRQHIYIGSEMNNFDVKYRSDKIGFSPSFHIVNKLIESSILKEYGDSYSFTHKYLYYYFVAYHFSKNIDKDEYTSEITRMAKLVYMNEPANILMFIVHFIPPESVIQILLNEAQQIFAEIAEFTFKYDEIKKINQLIENDTSHKLINMTLEESHEKDAEKQDTIEKHSLKASENLHRVEEEELTELDIFNKLNLATKLMEILGEITKNYAGSLNGNIIKELVVATYGLGLRSLKNIIEMFEENHELLIEHLSEQITKKSFKSEANIKTTVSQFVFQLISTISTDFIKKIAKAIGTKDLKQLYKNLSDNEPENNAYEIIKVAIDLNFDGGLNENKLISLHKQLQKDKNMLMNSTLKHLILEHLYMYENDHSKKASICTKLDIGVQSSKKAMIEFNK